MVISRSEPKQTVAHFTRLLCDGTRIFPAVYVCVFITTLSVCFILFSSLLRPSSKEDCFYWSG